MTCLRDSVEIYPDLTLLSFNDGEQTTRNLLFFIYFKQTFLHDLSLFNIERIKNFRMKKLWELTLYRLGSDSFLLASRAVLESILPVCKRR